MFRHIRNITVKQRLVALTVIALLPGMVVLAYLVGTYHQSREREVHELALRYGQLASLEMDRIVSGAEGTLRALAAAPTTRSFDPARCSAYLAEVTAELPQFTAIAAIDSAGLLRCRTTMPAAPIRLNDRPYFRQVMETGKFVVGEYTKSAVTNVAILPLAFPIRDKAGTNVGVLVAGLDLTWLGARLKDRDFLQDSALTIADRNGVIIAREPFSAEFVGTRIPEKYQHLVRGTSPGSLEVLSQDGTPRVIGYYPASYTSSGLYVSAGLSTEIAFQAAYAATYRSLMIALAGALVALAITWIAGDRFFVRPIERLLRTVSAWRNGDHTARSNVASSGGELAALGAAIDEYMDELVIDRAARIEAEERRDLVVRELDHRVKNILATVQAVASQSFSGQATRESLRAFAGRLSAMAAIHETLMSDDWVSAEFRATLETALRPFEEAERERFSLTGPDLVIGAKAALAISMAVHELCTNAVKYGALKEADGHIFIAWTVGKEPEGEVFELSWVERDGPPVQPPGNSGFGSRMIERVLASELSGTVELRFSPTGVHCLIRSPAASVLAPEEADQGDQQAA